MAYGTVKVDNITFTNGGIDQTVTVSGIVQSISGNITATGTIQAATIIGTSTVSGATVTGNAGVFTTVTGGSAGFTTVTGTTVTGTTANFATISGTTITGGAVTVASGTFSGNSTAAAFIPTGSTVPTNGLYLPAANSVALSTNGAGRLFVDASGNVGVGVSSGGPSSNDLLLIGNKAIRWQHSTNGTQYGDIYTDASSNIVFRNGGSSTERLRITSAGLVGIGTSSPNYKLHVSGDQISLDDSTGTATLNIGTTNNGSARLKFWEGGIGSGNGYSFGMVGASNALSIEMQGTGEIVRFASDGKVGIGTTSPGELLDIAGSSPTIKVYGSANSGANTLYSSFNGGDFRVGIENSTGSLGYGGSAYARYLYSSGSHPLVISTNGLERMRIDSSGRLLVGTSTDSGGSKLQINDNRIRIATAKTPASATDTGVTGEICWDANYVYVCTATNTWKRTALATW